jgi:hypothetical protein
MSQSDVTEITNRIVSYAVPGIIAPKSRQFPRSAEGISIPPEFLQAYYATVRELFQAEKVIAATYSVETFEKRVIKLIAPFVVANQTVDRKTVIAFLRQLKDEPFITHDVFRPIHRITKGADSGPIVLGGYTLYNTIADACALNEALRGTIEESLLDMTDHYLIRCSVEARDQLIALELADARFEQFENAIYCMLGTEKRFAPTIFGSPNPIAKTTIVMSKATWSSSIGSESLAKDLDVDDPYFLSVDAGFDRIWENLGAASNTKLMQKILLAVDWVGQSIAEKVSSSAFIKAAIALEVLFTPEKGNFAPSIVFQITESVTLLLGTDEESRIQYEREFKRLYEIRSSIAHAGKTDVEQDDLVSIQEMARQVIFRLLTAPLIKGCKTPDELNAVLKKLKYSCPAITVADSPVV